MEKGVVDGCGPELRAEKGDEDELLRVFSSSSSSASFHRLKSMLASKPRNRKAGRKVFNFS